MKNTQRRKKTLDWQLGNRFAKTGVITTALARMSGDCTSLVPPKLSVLTPGMPVHATKGQLRVYWSRTDRPQWEFKWNNGSSYPHYLDTNLQVLAQHIVVTQNNPDIPKQQYTIDVFTEYAQNGVIFRCRPLYKHSAHWYDWVMVRWESTGRQQHAGDNMVHYGDIDYVLNKFDYSPCRIEMFALLDMKPIALVSACDIKCVRSSVFSTYWKMSYENNQCTRVSKFIVEPSSFVRHCLMIPENNEVECGGFHEIWSKSHWADKFQV
jgi:hypothetical protein